MPFSEKTLDFLFQNRVMDSKAWFLEHRSEYEAYALQPMRELVTALEPVIHSIDPLLICEPKIGRSVSRIYRDTRFSRDKSVFRDVMWCVFVRSKSLREGSPGFWFEFSPRGMRWGCGYAKADGDSMDAARRLILSGDKSFKAAFKAFKMQSLFYLEDTKYVRSRHPDQPEEIREWLDQRSLCFMTDSDDFDLLFSDELADRLSKDFRLLEPMYGFMTAAEARVIKIR